MGLPAELREVQLQVADESLAASCSRSATPVHRPATARKNGFVDLGPRWNAMRLSSPHERRVRREVEASDRIRILIWERGCGPTLVGHRSCPLGPPQTRRRGTIAES
jgi:hypothetical protein